MAGPIERVLVLVDGTEESITAAQYAILLAGASGAELFGAYVINTRALNELLKSRIFVEAEEQEYEQDLHSDAERYLKHVGDLAESKGVPIKTLTASGSVHQEVVKMVREHGIDLLVIGELAHAKSRRDEFYNESERAMRSVGCSVLIVKDQERVWDLFEYGFKE
ncbi:MAG: universal stress protein [Spirochaetota bacterium]